MSIIASAPRASESNHWYTLDGAPMYTVEGKNGLQRPTTLRDARKLSLVPSVTTVMNVAAKPALNAWMQRQVLLAALTLPKIDSETEDQYIDRIIQDSKEQGKAAADAGTAIHESIQSCFEGGVYSEAHNPHVEACRTALVSKFGQQDWICERAFAHEIGFGGKVDLHAENLVVDIKTKEFAPGDEVKPYDDHLIQLAAYRVGLGMPTARCANIFVSRNHPGAVSIHEWTEQDLNRGWRMFHLLLQFWYEKTGLHEKD